MRSAPPNLLPLFRSDAQARLLAEIFLSPEPLSVPEIATRTGIPESTLRNEVPRLERAGIIRSTAVGRTKLLRPEIESPIHAEVAGLITKALGPAVVLRTLLTDIDGLEQAYIYGSWAARIQGEDGPSPQDIDLLLVGAPRQLEIARVCRSAEERLGRDVNATTVERLGLVRAVERISPTCSRRAVGRCRDVRISFGRE